MDQIVIVGASLAGVNAARTLRNEGFTGSLVVLDSQAHQPYDRPPLSKQLLTAAGGSPPSIRLPGLDELDITWRLGESATGVDLAEGSIEVDGAERLAFDGLVLAAGATARRLPGTDALAGVTVLRTLDDAAALRERLDAGPGSVAVVGAGFIGAEVAASCRERGAAVTLIEAAAVPLAHAVGAGVGAVLADLHRAHGVDVRLATGVERIEQEDPEGEVSVHTAVGEPIVADVVVVGIGVQPVTDWLEGSGLVLGDGVVCDDRLLAAPRVVAAGDLARWPSRRYGELLRVEHWEHAIVSGEAAAQRLLAEVDDSRETPPPFDPVPWFWSDQYDCKIQLAGRSGADHDVDVVVGSLEERRFVAVYGRDGTATGVLGMNRPRHVTLLRQRLVEGCTYAELRDAARDL